jgi:hypothetical protein
MKAYTNYKKWWLEYEAPSKVPSLYWGQSAEEAFSQHISILGLYGLMEILKDIFDEDETTQ